MIEVVQELGLEEEQLEGIQRDWDMIEIMLKDDVEIDLDLHNSNEENKYLINRVKDIKNTVKLRGLNLLKDADDWKEYIRRVMEPYAVEIFSIEATKFTSKRLGDVFFYGKYDGGYLVSFKPVDNLTIPECIPIKGTNCQSGIRCGSKRAAQKMLHV